MGERVDAADRFKSLTDKALGLVEPASKDTAAEQHLLGIIEEETPQLDRPSAQLRRNQLDYFLKKLSPIQRARNEKIAWFCLTVHPNGNRCETINGTLRNREEPRKTCSKCGQYRNNPRSIYEELIADVIVELEKAGINTEGLEL